MVVLALFRLLCSRAGGLSYIQYETQVFSLHSSKSTTAQTNSPFNDCMLSKQIKRALVADQAAAMIIGFTGNCVISCPFSFPSIVHHEHETKKKRVTHSPHIKDTPPSLPPSFIFYLSLLPLLLLIVWLQPCLLSFTEKLCICFVLLSKKRMSDLY